MGHLARLPTRGLVQTGALRAVQGRKWPGIFSAPLPRALRAQHWCPANMGKSLFRGCLAPWGWMPMQVLAPHAWRGLQRLGLWCCCGSPGPHAGVNQAHIEFSPHTSHLQACSEKKGPVFLELPASPLPTAWAPAAAGSASRAYSVYLCTMGSSRPPPLTPSNQEKTRREAAASMTWRGRGVGAQGWCTALRAWLSSDPSLSPEPAILAFSLPALPPLPR